MVLIKCYNRIILSTTAPPDLALVRAIVRHQRSTNIVTVRVRHANPKKTSTRHTRTGTKRVTSRVNVSTDHAAGVFHIRRHQSIAPVIRSVPRIKNIRRETIRRTKTAIIPRTGTRANTGMDTRVRYEEINMTNTINTGDNDLCVVRS